MTDPTRPADKLQEAVDAQTEEQKRVQEQADNVSEEERLRAEREAADRAVTGETP